MGVCGRVGECNRQKHSERETEREKKKFNRAKERGGSNEFSWNMARFPTLTMYSLCFLSHGRRCHFAIPLRLPGVRRLAASCARAKKQTGARVRGCTGGEAYLHSHSCIRGYKLDQSGRQGNLIALRF